jgi:hypothetical protein
MTTLERRKSHEKTVYYAKVRIKGQERSTTFHSLSQAWQWARRVDVSILEGKLSPVKHTLSDLWWKRHIGYYSLCGHPDGGHRPASRFLSPGHIPQAVTLRVRVEQGPGGFAWRSRRHPCSLHRATVAVWRRCAQARLLQRHGALHA